jgi:hypothetical protein
VASMSNARVIGDYFRFVRYTIKFRRWSGFPTFVHC